ncbi:hypothetical protein FF1_018126 [Malus domestica]
MTSATAPPSNPPIKWAAMGEEDKGKASGFEWIVAEVLVDYCSGFVSLVREASSIFCSEAPILASDSDRN